MKERTAKLQREIDERKQVEEKFRNLMKIIHVGIAISTLEGAITEANSSIKKLFAYCSKEKILKMPASSPWTFTSIASALPLKAFASRVI